MLVGRAPQAPAAGGCLPEFLFCCCACCALNRLVWRIMDAAQRAAVAASFPWSCSWDFLSMPRILKLCLFSTDTHALCPTTTVATSGCTLQPALVSLRTSGAYFSLASKCFCSIFSSSVYFSSPRMICTEMPSSPSTHSAGTGPVGGGCVLFPAFHHHKVRVVRDGLLPLGGVP